MTVDEVIAMLQEIAATFGKRIPAPVVACYAAEAMKTGPEEFCIVLGALATGLGHLPSLRQIREEMGVAEPTAQESAAGLWARVETAVRRYGSYRLEEARDALGPTAWKLVSLLGGWEAVCQDDQRTMRYTTSYRLSLARVCLKEERMTRRLEGAHGGETITVSLPEKNPYEKEAQYVQHAEKAASEAEGQPWKAPGSEAVRLGRE